ncbi:hypothetical protein MNEG_16382 [Monoraphidium neglectum]|uniref:Uncharacterized protein n=1 Tax=Monoraphidium neglectum TaxID=145388 RepID=A0A0D2IUG9_9CHLO|nr:hypothetical protein MNEG_16382 [Monoraphidium neglectum]KIY91582.1 hypothetical protein MNEG_16382 [Monoraphidium neglectum]|eukprot:XP_013890602.1 hypothetical protein MNEG_16382 [Monoraphidium neglectum]
MEARARAETDAIISAAPDLVIQCCLPLTLRETLALAHLCSEGRLELGQAARGALVDALAQANLSQHMPSQAAACAALAAGAVLLADPTLGAWGATLLQGAGSSGVLAQAERAAERRAAAAAAAAGAGATAGGDEEMRDAAQPASPAAKAVPQPARDRRAESGPPSPSPQAPPPPQQQHRPWVEQARLAAAGPAGPGGPSGPSGPGAAARALADDLSDLSASVLRRVVSWFQGAPPHRESAEASARRLRRQSLALSLTWRCRGPTSGPR